ncbi:MAG: aminotransferase class I/II-fold pyridoxal phosphate-dependent enzyme [Candidatus Sericytochromatia bacterium]
MIDFNKFYNLTSDWKQNWENFELDSSLQISEEKLNNTLKILQEKLKNNYPFHHPFYAGQMLKPPHFSAIAGYLATMVLNPNNHALDGGPATAELEKECIIKLANMFGFDKHLGHLTSSGTIANLEALWISRELNPDKYIVYSEQAHYTHSRMCNLLNVKHKAIKSDNLGKMDVNNLEKLLEEIDIGTVVVTLGTTGLGSLDPLDKILELQKKYNFRIHIDSAYGGFYSVLKDDSSINGKLFSLIKHADSIVIDPHKHGLQPYGCGCIIFSNPEVGKFYSHDSPYTYFTSNELHLGEISLECSRAGASAAAFWTTLELFPLEKNNGFGNILRKTREAALKFSELVKKSDKYDLVLEPELDIVCYYPKVQSNKVSDISSLTEKIFDELELKKELYLAKFKVKNNLLEKHNLIWDQEFITVFRSCFMKPEHLDYINIIFEKLEKGLIECQK